MKSKIFFHTNTSEHFVIQLTSIRAKAIMLIFLSAIIGCTSTEPIQTKPFPEKNLPEHVFRSTYADLKDTIISMFTIENQLDNKILNQVFYEKMPTAGTMPLTFAPETNKDTLFSKEYFSKAGTANDIFLHDFRFAWMSKLYYSNDHSLKYTADFIVRLFKVNDSSTKVSIIAYRPEVINGIARYGPHGAVARYTPVLATTIEEYTLLQFIASKLGDSTLLPIKLPKN